MIAYTYVAEAEWGQMDNGDSLHYCSESMRRRCVANEQGSVWHKRSLCFPTCHAVEISDVVPSSGQGA